MPYREVTYLAIVLRVVCAVFIGGIIGLDRGLKKRPAGFRTYMLVCVGACLIMLTNQYIYQVTGVGDPMRLGAQVVSGIGFLGAGTIMVTRHNRIRGLTTAAGLWSAAGVGLALGIGFYEAALVGGIAIYLALTLFQRWDDNFHRKSKILELYLELHKSVAIAQMTEDFNELGLAVEHIALENLGPSMTPDSRSMIITLRMKKRADHISLREQILQIQGVLHIEEL